ncbi:MAG: MarR family winged helix-turn-helix transcriptional regulator [Eubacterium sp.]
MSLNYENPSPPPQGMIGPRVTRISRILRRRFNKVSNEEGLFSGQQHIILLLKHNRGLTVGQLAERLGVAPATVSVSIKRMEKAGFVEKTADENDARITKLYLTEKGEAAPDHIKEKMDSQEKYITNGMSKEEVRLFSDLLDKAINNLLEQEEDIYD